MLAELAPFISPQAMTLAVVACALGAIACEGPHRRDAFYLLKPLTTLTVIALLWCLNHVDEEYRRRITLAMLFCLGGDIALLGRSDRSFLIGAFLFLVGHILFIGAFAGGLPSLDPPPWTALIVPFALLALVSLWPRIGTMRPAVVAYTLVLVAMWATAATRYEALDNQAAEFAILGATLFILSDGALSMQRFVGPYRGADAVVLSTYWASMTLLAWSVAGTG